MRKVSLTKLYQQEHVKSIINGCGQFSNGSIFRSLWWLKNNING